MAEPALRVDDLQVSYGATIALDTLSLEVERGELVALLGPSGCGKTTLLHAIAGFLPPQRGSIWIGGRQVAGPGRLEPPERRHVGLVFQGYALWPHLTVLRTVIYPLERQGVHGPAAERRARELLQHLGIQDLAGRLPSQLSGGQQQRVGLARALAASPELFLFDEPTANLDVALREAFQEEIARERRAHGAAGLWVTHDAAEAFTAADRVAVLREGRLIQIGTPLEVYERPRDPWVGLLTGRGSVLQTELVALQAGGPHVEATLGFEAGGTLVTSAAAYPGGQEPSPGPVRILVRPEWARLDPTATIGIPARVMAVRFQGPHTDYHLEGAGDVLVRVPGPPQCASTDRVSWCPERVWILPAAEASHG